MSKQSPNCSDDEVGTASKVSPHLTQKPTSSVLSPNLESYAGETAQDSSTGGPVTEGPADVMTAGVGTAVAPTAALTAAPESAPQSASLVGPSNPTGSPGENEDSVPLNQRSTPKVSSSSPAPMRSNLVSGDEPLPDNVESAAKTAAEDTDWKPKMCIIGINKKWDNKRLAHYLTSQSVKFQSISKLYRKSVAFITFSSPDEKEVGIKQISTLTGNEGSKGRPWLVADAKVQANDSKGAKGRRKRAEFEGVGPDGISKKQKLIQAEQVTKTARDAVTPHWRVPYPQQIAAKHDSMVNTLKRFRRRVRKEITKHSKKRKGKHPSGSGPAKGDGVDWDKYPMWLRPAGGFAGVLLNSMNSDVVHSESSSSQVASDASARELKFTHGLPCPMESILGMTDKVLEGAAGSGSGRFNYRNKCEFTVGKNRDGEIVLGFRVSAFGDGVFCESPQDCGNVPEASKKLCHQFEKFIKSSTLPIYDVMTHNGVWRQLTVQYSARTKHLRGIVQVKTQGVAAEAWASEKERMLSWCRENSQEVEDGVGLTGMLIQYYDGPSMPKENDPSAVPQLVWGEPDLEELLCVPGPVPGIPTPTLRFLVSPGAFFQVNTPGCERLYEIVGRFADANISNLQAKTDLDKLASDQDPLENIEKTPQESVQDQKETEPQPTADKQAITLLDVCCGTGTIGLCVAASMPSVKKVVGVELCKAAVDDAKRNAELNNQGDTAHFFASAAEKILPNLLSKNVTSHAGIKDTLAKCGTPIVPSDHHCVAVVDPPRSGLHPKVVRALRECKAIDRLIYVSCNPTGTFVEDAIKLCLPSHCNKKWSPSEPFLPLRAAPVDMFPDTKHCELVVVFARASAVTRESVAPKDYSVRDAQRQKQTDTMGSEASGSGVAVRGVKRKREGGEEEEEA